MKMQTKPFKINIDRFEKSIFKIETCKWKR